jgi:galactoside O-acetyltransferase
MAEYKDLEFMNRFKYVGEGVEVYANALILRPEVISVGDGVRIDDFCRIEGGQGVRIGAYTHISSFSSILAGGACELGRFVGIAQGARLITGGGFPFEDEFPVVFPMKDLYFRKTGVITVGDYGVVGANAVVLPDVHIGEGGIVSAGTVATKDVKEWSIIFGQTGTLMGRRSKPSTKRTANAIE